MSAYQFNEDSYDPPQGRELDIPTPDNAFVDDPIFPAGDTGFARQDDDVVVGDRGGTVLDELRVLATYTPGVDEERYPLLQIRPLGPLSDFVVNDLGVAFDDISAGRLRVGDVFGDVERKAHALGHSVVSDLMASPDSRETQTAIGDLVFVERVLNVASGADRKMFLVRRDASLFYSMTRHLSVAVGRYPLLQWTDIADRYSSNDPRTFLSPGHDRLQEIHLYRVQSAIERGCRAIVRCWAGGHPDVGAQEQILAVLDGVARSMANLTRKRQPGEFDKLDRFLSPNGEVVGHATGSFSAWTKLAGYLCTGRSLMLGSVSLPRNQAAFVPEVGYWVQRIEAGEVTPLRVGVDERAEEVAKRATDFQLIHRGAVKKHARGAMGNAAPAFGWLSNIESMNRSITGTCQDKIRDDGEDVPAGRSDEDSDDVE